MEPTTSTSPLSDVQITAVMTCHNRRDLSLRLVSALQKQSEAGVAIDIVALDDGSSDGTGAALRAKNVRVLNGDGSLYWAGGMRKACTFALSLDPDILLWVNDDLDLEANAIKSLLEAYWKTSGQSILVGKVVSTSTGAVSYGGRNQSPENPLSFRLAEEGDAYSAVDTFNGNFIGIPRAVYNRVDFPRGYRHAYADLAFGILAARAGFKSILIPKPVGTNDRNPLTGKMFLPDIALIDRVKFALSPFGLPPLQHWRFAMLVSGFAAPYWFARSYGRVIMPAKQSDHHK